MRRTARVFGPTPELPQGWSLASEEADSFDAVLVTGPTDRSWLIAWLYDSGAPLAPLIDFTDGAHARTDLSAPFVAPETLAAGLARAEAIVEELKSASPIPLNQDRDGLIALGLALSRKIAIEPSLDPGRHDLYHFPLLEGIAEAVGCLEMLARSGLVKRSFHDRVYVCENCQSARLSVREVCTSCRSSQINEETLVHHYRCGNQAPRSAFLHGHALICSKCREPLRHFGVDYDTPGQIISCASCGVTASEPDIDFLCTDCAHVTAGDAAKRREWYSYSLTEAGEIAVIGGHLPGTHLQAMMSGLKGWRSLPEMVALLDLCIGLAKRYKRPFSVVTLEPADQAAIIARSGRSGLARLYRLLVDLVKETVRTTDGVGVFGDRIIICMPETPHENSSSLARRLKEHQSSAIIDSEAVKFDVLCPEDIAKLVEDMRQT